MGIMLYVKNIPGLLTLVIGACMGFDLPELLTEQQRIRIFGTNDSQNLPIIQTVQIELLNIQNIKPFRKRPPSVLQYRTTINDEVLTLTLRPNRQFIAPGCLVHHYQKNSNKLLYPCFKDDKHCYYTGKSATHNDSWVAASVCGGLRGAIVYGNMSFIIAPLKKTEYPDLTSAHGTKHVIYRYQGDKQRCSTSYPKGHIVYPSHVRQRRTVQVNVSHDVTDDIRPRYMEVGVVIDPTMNNFHGDDTDQYTAIALNLASHLYSNRRTGVDIVLVLTAVYKMESYEKFNIEQTRDAQKLLDQFCRWKSSSVAGSLDTDATVFLTKTNIAYNGQGKTTGLAHPSSMCVEGMNCALVEDTGPDMGYTIAHEIGHLLSMRHDGPGGDTNCTGSSIMNVYGASGEAASTWSTCSQLALKDFLSTKGPCLYNKPAGYSHQPSGYQHSDSKVELPGVIYPADVQCQMIMGPNASLCVLHPNMVKNLSLNNSCEQLICKENNYAMCYLLTPPLLDGTDINNTRTWCIDGRPVSMTADLHTPPIHGSWSDWSAEWTTCSRTCGGGVRIRRRYCNNPKPQFTGNDCPGSDVKAILCNMKKCNRSYKETQCSRLNNNMYEKYGNITFKFVPYLLSKGDDSCKQQCKGSSPLLGGNRSVFLNNTKANLDDGTECVLDKYVPFTRCIDGKCRSFGCDGHLESGLVFDKCGECNGTGNTCRTGRGKFAKNGNQSGALVQGERVFNSDGTDVAGVFLSSGVDRVRIHYNNYPEQIVIPGPIPTDVYLQVYRKYDYRQYAGVTPNISYEYNTAIKQHPGSYYWSAVQTQCSKPCGLGITVRTVGCRDSKGPVEDYHCRIEDKLSEIPQPCNTHYCPPRWFKGRWSTCSVTCGRGFRNRSVDCVQEKDDSFVLTNDSYCHKGERPSNTQICDMGRCPSVWRTNPWSQCSMTCGLGQQYRTVQCYDEKTFNRVDDALCSIDLKPDQVQFCNQGPCWTAIGEKCKDADLCAGYDQGLCVGTYKTWALKNCLILCGICSVQAKDTCIDTIQNCDHYDLKTVCEQYDVWANKSCRRSCGLCEKCEDKFDACAGYGSSICTSIDYRQWAKENCYRFCGYCCDDEIPNCHQYGLAACTNPTYRLYMENHCSRYCKIC